MILVKVLSFFFIILACIASAVKCPSCGYENTGEDRYCLNCAAELRELSQEEIKNRKILNEKKAAAAFDNAESYFNRAQKEKDVFFAINYYEKAYSNSLTARSSGAEILTSRMLARINNIIEISGDELSKLRKYKNITGKRIRLEKKNGLYMIPAVINGGTETRLILDTGCSHTLVSPELADKLGVKSGIRVKSVVADGRTVDAKAILLDSVEVAGFRAENVTATIHETGGGDGLLGMAFFKNFMFKIDTSRDELILEIKR